MATTGRDILVTLLGGDEKFWEAIQQIEAKDPQSAELVKDVGNKIAEALNLDERQMDALHRLQWAVGHAASADGDQIRNNVFKAANAVGMKTSGFFERPRRNAIIPRG